jgi:hypothetical protein
MLATPRKAEVSEIQSPITLKSKYKQNGKFFFPILTFWELTAALLLMTVFIDLGYFLVHLVFIAMPALALG